MLKFRNESWHARLHRQAYADDREWLDHPILGGEWRGKSAEKAAMVRARLDAGRMSICPYFWKTLYAFVAYCFVAVPTYATRNFLRANWRLVIAFQAGAAVFALIAGAWWVRGDIAALPGRLAGHYRVQQAENDALDRKYAEADKERREHEEFLRQHPDVAAQEEAKREQRERDAEAWYKEYEAKANAKFVAGLKKAAPWLIGISAAITLLFLYTPLLNLLLVAFVLLIMIPLERTRWGRALLEAWAVCVWWFLELPGRIWRATMTFFRDTWQFLRAYVMAVKERVCPFITFVDGHPTS